MKLSLRKLALTAHMTLSVGWLGTIVAYLALAVVGLMSQDVQMRRAAYLSMDVLARFVIVPFSLATLLVGLLESLGTPWGLTPYGQRRRLAPRSLAAEGFHAVMEPVVEPRRGTRPSMPRWIYVVGFHAIGLAVLFLIAHLTGIAPNHH